MVCGWSTINFNELQSENCTFPTGPLNLEEASLVVSLINVGGFFGNWLALPMNNMFGIKRSIHLFGLPLIVRFVYFSKIFYIALWYRCNCFLVSWVHCLSFGLKMCTICMCRGFYRVWLVVAYQLALQHWYRTYHETSTIRTWLETNSWMKLFFYFFIFHT